MTEYTLDGVDFASDSARELAMSAGLAAEDFETVKPDLKSGISVKLVRAIVARKQASQSVEPEIEPEAPAEPEPEPEQNSERPDLRLRARAELGRRNRSGPGTGGGNATATDPAPAPGAAVHVTDDKGQVHEAVLVCMELGAMVRLRDEAGTTMFVRHDPFGRLRGSYRLA